MQAPPQHRTTCSRSLLDPPDPTGVRHRSAPVSLRGRGPIAVRGQIRLAISRIDIAA